MFQFSRMTGTILNAAAILLGGIAGLTAGRQPSLVHQTALKILLGAFTVYAGLSATWQALSGTLAHVLKQLTIVLLALMLGNLTGKLLRIQKSLNHLGQYAKQMISAVRPTSPRRYSEGFITCSILFCVTPIAVLGSLQDGFAGNFKTLAVKSVMDGLATMAFVTSFGWGAMLSVIPVIACQGTLALLARLAEPWLDKNLLLDPINATAGMLVFCIALIILDLKKIELADYLPSLVFAPLLAWWWR
jgi:uncharacterized membrane protein YqgA involved in biofilm formation